MRFYLLSLALALSACGARHEPKDDKPTPAVASTQTAEPAEAEPERVVLREVRGADDHSALGKPVIRAADGTLRVGAGRGHVGIVMTWIAPGVVEVEVPVK